MDGKMVIKLKIPKSPEEDDVIKRGKKVCLECNKEFRSGKALGGHMRVHLLQSQNPNHSKPSKQDYYIKDEGKPSCSQCGKTFPSMKSLFGHMRCHPERVWRGILPPPNTAITSASGNSTCIDDDDQMVDLTKYLQGWSVTERRGRKPLKAAEEDDNDDVLLAAVEDLMSLANAASGASDNESSDGKYKYKIKRRKKMKLMMELELELESESEAVSKYKCTTCNKCFTTYQALGGHRSSHNKSSKKIEEQAPSSQITSAGEEGSQTGSGRKVLEFDLNEIPLDMMEEDEFACSSYNSNMS